MFDVGLKTSLWVEAEIRRCDSLFLPAAIMYKGDGDRGLVLIKQYIAGEGCYIYSQRRNMDGILEWQKPMGSDPKPENEADQYIERQRKFDEDLWVIEIDDPKGQYSPQDAI